LAVATPTRPRAGSSRLFIVAGVVLAALAFLIMILLGGRGPGGTGVSGSSVNIVVAARDIPFRTPLSRDDLTLKQWPSSLQPTGSFTSINDLLGKQASTSSATNTNGYVAEVQIHAGQPVTDNLLARSIDAVQLQPAYLPIPKGFEAVTVPTNEQQGVAFFIQPGDYINIIATAQVTIFSTGTGQQQGPPKTVTKTVFTNVHVLKVGPATGQVSTGSSSSAQAQASTATSLTLVMTECDAEMLRWLQANSTISYTLPSYQDYQPSDARPDPSCLSATDGHGVGPGAADARWHFTSQN
jgi:pilus assembly protein CpaB